MHPFTQEKRRKINLGGATSVASQTDILHSAKARRNEREEIRRRHESALCIQSRWRGFQQYRAVRQRLSRMFQEDVLGLNGMRALVLIGNDDLLLAQWSEAVIRAGGGEFSTILHDLPNDSVVSLYPTTLSSIQGFHRRISSRWLFPQVNISSGWPIQYVSGPDSKHWIVLLRKLSIFLLRSVANSPQYVPHRLVSCAPFHPISPSAAASLNHLRVLDALLSPASSARSLGERSEDLRTDLTLYVMQRGFYPLLAKALRDIVRFDQPTRITL